MYFDPKDEEMVRCCTLITENARLTQTNTLKHKIPHTFILSKVVGMVSNLPDATIDQQGIQFKPIKSFSFLTGEAWFNKHSCVFKSGETY